MNSTYSKIQRTVIDENLIIQCIKEAKQSEIDAKDDENNNSSYANCNKHNNDFRDDVFGNKEKELKEIKKQLELVEDTTFSDEEIDFVSLCKLSLSFRDIYRIDHLCGFSSLIELRLDNNLISKIENLDHLINLKWLDLSFNNISKLEGLNNLKNLTDLCLVNNFIKKIENLENNLKLEVLSLGNNCIDSIQNIAYLKQFNNLRAINLCGNPIYNNNNNSNNTKISIYSYCNSLKFLNYRRIKQSDIKNAKNINIQKNELNIINKKEKEIKKNEIISKNKLYLSANIDGVYTLFTDMIRDDSEMNRLQYLPGFNNKLNEYSSHILQYSHDYIQNVINVYNKKIKNDEIFNKTLNKISIENEKESINIINEFELEINEINCNSLINNLSSNLMELEMKCCSKINFIINIYEDRITDLMKKNLTNAESYFGVIQNLQNDYNQNLLDLIANILEKIKENGIDSIICASPENESIRNMIMDKESINNSITLSHDNHISHIGRLEDLVRDREEKEKKEKMDKRNNEEYKRNRQRISEILILIQKYSKQFNVKMDN